MRSFAVIFFLAAATGGFIICLSIYAPQAMKWPLVWFAPMIFAFVVFSLTRRNHRADYEKQLREWEEKGLLETRLYRARRAFEVAEWEDEGLHYFVELEGGAVLYLNGQYLYEYAPIDDEKYPEEDQPRRFPCTEFAMRWHREKKFFVDFKCGDGAFEPELVAPPFSRKGYRSNIIPEDGQLLIGSYDEWKARCTASTREAPRIA